MRGLISRAEAVAGSQAIDGSAAEVFDDDVGLLQQIGKNGLGFWMLQIQGHAQFIAQAVDGGDGNIVGMPARERGTFRTKIRRIFTASIGAGGTLYFDDTRAESGEEHGSEGACERRRQIQNGDIFERPSQGLRLTCHGLRQRSRKCPAARRRR